MAEQPLPHDPPPSPRARAASVGTLAQLRRRLGSGEGLLRIIVLLAAGIIVVLFATQWNRWVGGGSRQVTDDAYVRSDITPLSAKVEGYVKVVAVDDFQRVKAGDLLVEIESSDYQARVAQAEADLLGAQAAIENLKARKSMQKAQVAEAEAAVTAMRADVERTRQEAVRQRALLATTFGTPQKVEQADAEEKRLAANATAAGLTVGACTVMAAVSCR